MHKKVKPAPKLDLALLAERQRQTNQRIMAQQFEEEMYCQPLSFSVGVDLGRQSTPCVSGAVIRAFTAQEREEGKKLAEELLQDKMKAKIKALKGFGFQSTPHTKPNSFKDNHLANLAFLKNYTNKNYTNPCCEVNLAEPNIVNAGGSFEPGMLQSMAPAKKPVTDPLVDWLYKDRLAAARRLNEPVKLKPAVKEEDKRTNRDRMADDKRLEFASNIRYELGVIASTIKMIEQHFRQASKYGVDLPGLEYVKDFIKSFRDTIKKEDCVK